MTKKQIKKSASKGGIALVAIMMAILLAGTDSPPECADGIDNDGDGLIDIHDPECIASGDPSNHDSEDSPGPPGGP